MVLRAPTSEQFLKEGWLIDDSISLNDFDWTESTAEMIYTTAVIWFPEVWENCGGYIP